MTEQEIITNWINRSLSNLELAKTGRVNENILLEDLCFDCQQCVEKAIKGLLVFKGIEFPKIHSIGKLIKLLEDNGVELTETIKDAVILNNYAVETRYPGDYEPITEEEYKQALELAETVFKWVNDNIQKQT